jgi:hypothetical protein
LGRPNIWDRGAALTSTLHWFETELLTREENLVCLMGLTQDLSDIVRSLIQEGYTVAVSQTACKVTVKTLLFRGF